jgi:hypothetical protein
VVGDSPSLVASSFRFIGNAAQNGFNRRNLSQLAGVRQNISPQSEIVYGAECGHLAA